MSEKLTYKDSGVNKEAGYESVELIKKHVKATMNPYALTGLGGFGGAVEIPESIKSPILVSGTDGVGTKLIVAQQMDVHDTVGIDLVAMCVNDVLCNGAMPLYFLDYIACGKNYPEKIEQIVKGVSEGCIQSGCALIGGETAEMPGMYKEDDYDLAGFTTGVVSKDKFIDSSKIAEGDVLIGLKSSGVHSNGFSLIRKILFEIKNYDVNTFVDSLGKTLGEELLTPTKIYVKPVLNLLDKIDVHGMCHITGGGYSENIPRMIPDGLMAEVNVTKTEIPEIFKFIMNEGEISKEEMYGTFNMGTGFVIAVAKEDADKTLNILNENGEEPVIIGDIKTGEEKIKLWL